MRARTRREFLKGAGLTVAVGVSGCGMMGDPLPHLSERPNILWLTCEDLSPWLGCYGDPQADTPHLDALAEQGTRYLNAFASSPVCAPARSCLITGLYANALGTQHLRSSIRIPDSVRCFPAYLREAGYYCMNNVKKDYSFVDVGAWDESSTEAHWRNRPAGRPFFAVFNHMITHQSRLNGSDVAWFNQYGHLLKAERRHDPARLRIPPYYPDTPEIRKMWARYYDLASIMDDQVGELLRQLEADGLADHTIVFFYADHGSGIPRHKRALHDSGLRVPLIVRFPQRWRHLAPTPPGQTTDRLVSFVDFGPTVLSLAQIRPPDVMQGRPFLGRYASRPRRYIFAHASRVDEAYDMSRCVSDGRYKYIRNFMPHLPWVQPSAYPDHAEIMQELRRALAAGEMNADQRALFEPRAAEELYDTQTDPHEIQNLAASPGHRAVLDRLRARLHAWMLRIGDTGLLPEAEMHIRSADSTPYETVRDSRRFGLKHILQAAEGMGTAAAATAYERLSDAEPAVRYWALVALAAPDASLVDIPHIESLLADTSPDVRFMAAALVARHGESLRALDVLIEGLDDPRGPVALAAARQIELLGDKAVSAVDRIAAARQANVQSDRHPDYKMFIDWALTYALRLCGRPTDYLITF